MKLESALPTVLDPVLTSATNILPPVLGMSTEVSMRRSATVRKRTSTSRLSGDTSGAGQHSGRARSLGTRRSSGKAAGTSDRMAWAPTARAAAAEKCAQSVRKAERSSTREKDMRGAGHDGSLTSAGWPLSPCPVINCAESLHSARASFRRATQSASLSPARPVSATTPSSSASRDRTPGSRTTASARSPQRSDCKVAFSAPADKATCSGLDTTFAKTEARCTPPNDVYTSTNKSTSESRPRPSGMSRVVIDDCVLAAASLTSTGLADAGFVE
mmetsp:Transcript_164692/g.528350  ORF Transcript_164692/g.528350 Transcript_164692/m.528350 type:complete len:273 (+) Transcript_164692:113-931(+)